MLIKCLHAFMHAFCLIAIFTIPSYSLELETDTTANINSEEMEVNQEDYDAFFNDDEKDILSLRFQFKDQLVYYKTEEYSKTGKEKDLISNLSRLRLSPELTLSENIFFHFDIDNELITGNYLKSYEFDYFWCTSDYNDLLHLSKEKYNKDYFYRGKIHSAYTKILINNLTLTLGRQQIRYGSGHLWNPLDILNPVSPLNLEGSDDQKGTDAVRAEYYITPTMEFSLVYSQKRKNDKFDDITIKNSNILGRFRMSVSDSEFAVLGGQVSRRNVGGADLSIILFDGTLRGSAIYNKPQEDKYGKIFIQASAGYEYNFSFGLYFLCEYFYNQNALNYNSDLNNTYLMSQIHGMNDVKYFSLSNQIITYNQHYSGLALGYNITPLLRIEGFSIYDYQGKAMFIYPELKYNIFENIDVSAGIMKAFLCKDDNELSDFGFVKKYPLVFASLVFFF
ncbi:MAG: hypothetical protein JW864_06475 [Spirochaetes bacterium]|nr:hypothetical protein [Spirochaetota bacterium]